jgi:hypothetical protein
MSDISALELNKNAIFGFREITRILIQYSIKYMEKILLLDKLQLYLFCGLINIQ